MTPNAPLLIVGAPRSGNTLVRRVLMASGQIYIPAETYVLGELISQWKRWRFLSWREKVWLFCAYFDRHPHWPELDIPSLTPFAATAEKWPKSQQNLRQLIDSLYRFFAAEHGFTESRWGDKTPWNTMHLKAITRFFPDAIFLHLVRDGRDSVASQLKADMRDFAESAERWVSANEMCEKYLPKARTLQMRYETLVQSPEESFREIFSWAGLEFEPEHLTKVPERLGDVTVRDHHSAVLKPITPNSIGNWRKSLSPEKFAKLPASFSTMMRKHGYA